MMTANAIHDSNGSNTWTLRLFTFLVWAAVGLCAAYWAFKFVTTKPVEATAAIATPAVVVDTKAIAKLLGASDNPAPGIIAAPKVKLSLFGLATTSSGHGVALIATEDKPAKPYRVGAKVTDDLVLKSISKVDAVLAASMSAPDGQKLSLPERKPATTMASPKSPPDKPQMPNMATSANAANGMANPPFNPTTNLPDKTIFPSPGVTSFIDPQRPVSRFAPKSSDAAAASAVGNAVQGATSSVLSPEAINAMIPGSRNSADLKN